MKLFFKGLIIGIGKILPGISGGLLAILLNVYDESIEYGKKIEEIIEDIHEEDK